MQELRVRQRSQQAFTRMPFETPQSLSLLDAQAETGHFQELSANASKQRGRIGAVATCFSTGGHEGTPAIARSRRRFISSPSVVDIAIRDPSTHFVGDSMQLTETNGL